MADHCTPTGNVSHRAGSFEKSSFSNTTGPLAPSIARALAVNNAGAIGMAGIAVNIPWSISLRVIFIDIYDSPWKLR